MKTIIIDNYDSFTYNLRHMISELGVDVDVVRNDKFEINDLEKYDKIILSPGPGIPIEAGRLMETIFKFADKKSILGVCLGEQAIGEAFGAQLINLEKVYHGVQTPIELIGEEYLFDGLPKKIQVGRYHSWVIDRESIKLPLSVTAISEEGLVMGVKHAEYDVHGIQFHPESVLTPEGNKIISNFINHKI